MFLYNRTIIDIVPNNRKRGSIKVGVNAFHEKIVEVGSSVNGSTDSLTFQAKFPLDRSPAVINELLWDDINPNLGVFSKHKQYSNSGTKQTIDDNPYFCRRKGKSTIIIYLTELIFLRLKKTRADFLSIN